MSSCFFAHAVRANKRFMNFVDAFFLTGNKIQEIAIFYSSFLKFALMEKLLSEPFLSFE